MMRPEGSTQFTEVARLSLEFDQMQSFGPSPEELVLSARIAGGHCGGGVRGEIISVGMEWSCARGDGIVEATLRCSVDASDALIAFSLCGNVDIGEDGYEALLRGAWPGVAPIDGSCRLYTTGPRWRWINRGLYFVHGERDYTARSLSCALYAVAHEGWDLHADGGCSNAQHQ